MLALPPIHDAALALWQHLSDAGLYSDGGMARTALTWADVQAWSSASAIGLAPWQLRAMVQASRAWVAENIAAADPDAPAPWPWLGEPEPVDRTSVLDKVRAIFGARARAGGAQG